jgi:predicted metal-dependent hydrolase
MSETLHLEGLAFSVRRSERRRTVGITVERDGALTVAAPVGVDLTQVERAVRGKLSWVFAKLAEKELLFQPGPEKEYVSGEGFHYLGCSYRLLLVDDPAPADGQPPLRLLNGRFRLSRAAQGDAAAAFVRWYTAHALAWLRQRVGLLSPRVGVGPRALRVLDLGNRWGSCGDDGVLNFHWRTIRLPPSLVEYVVAHELVHLLGPRHNAGFWSRLERLLPDWRARKRLLAEQGGRY